MKSADVSMRLSCLLTVLALAANTATADEPAAKPDTKPDKERDGLPLVLHLDFRDGEKALAAVEFTDPKAWKLIKTAVPDAKAGDSKPEQTVLCLHTKKSEYKPAVRSPFNIAWVKDTYVGEMILEARLRSTIPDYGHRDLCLFFGGVDAEHFFYVHLGKKADPNAHNVFIVDGKPRKNIAEKVTDGTPWDDNWHTVRVVRKPVGEITVFWDGQPIMSAKSDAFPAGRVGVGSFDDTGEFATITVWGKRTDKPTAPAGETKAEK